MIYLCRHLTTIDSKTYPMAGLLAFAAEMTTKLSQFGYTTVELTRDCLLGAQGAILRGHSFHYSRITGTLPTTTSYHAYYSLSGRDEVEGFSAGNILASYIHVHFRTDPRIPLSFTEFVRATKEKEVAPA